MVISATSCKQEDPSGETPNGSMWRATIHLHLHSSPLLFEPIDELVPGDIFLTLESWGGMMPTSTWLKVLTCREKIGWIYTGEWAMERVDCIIRPPS